MHCTDTNAPGNRHPSASPILRYDEGGQTRPETPPSTSPFGRNAINVRLPGKLHQPRAARNGHAGFRNLRTSAPGARPGAKLSHPRRTCKLVAQHCPFPELLLKLCHLGPDSCCPRCSKGGPFPPKTGTAIAGSIVRVDKCKIPPRPPRPLLNNLKLRI